VGHGVHPGEAEARCANSTTRPVRRSRGRRPQARHLRVGALDRNRDRFACFVETDAVMVTRRPEAPAEHLPVVVYDHRLRGSTAAIHTQEQPTLGPLTHALLRSPNTRETFPLSLSNVSAAENLLPVRRLLKPLSSRVRPCTMSSCT